MIHAMSMHHTSFTVSDMERSLRFYRDLLGMTVLVDQTPEADYLSQIVGFPNLRLRIVFLQTEDAKHRLELIQYLNHQGEPHGLGTNSVGTAHVCFIVEDLHATHRHLLDNGVEFISAPVLITAGVNKGAYSCYLRDPDGIPLELFQLPR